MDAINGVDPSAASAAGSLTQGTEMGREDFLLLLVTQLSNQDPLSPMDGQEFAAQLAQFSSLEQLIGIQDGIAQNGQLSGLLAQGINSGVAAGLIGKDIEAAGKDIFITDGEPTDIRLRMENTADIVTVEIKNEADQVVHTIEMGGLIKGDHDLGWDGTDADGNTLADGKYSINIKATDQEGNDIAADSYMQGTADRVTFGPEGILVWMGRTSIPLGNVSSVGSSE